MGLRTPENLETAGAAPPGVWGPCARQIFREPSGTASKPRLQGAPQAFRLGRLGICCFGRWAGGSGGQRDQGPQPPGALACSCWLWHSGVTGERGRCVSVLGISRLARGHGEFGWWGRWGGRWLA